MNTSAKNIQIIGIAGTNGSGKDTMAAMLARHYNYLNASATEMFLSELKSRGWPVDREHKAKLSAEWRREFGMGVIVDKAIQMYKNATERYDGIVVGSLRHPGEADRVHELSGKMVWIDADPEIRFKRIQSNLEERRGKHAEEGKTYEEFLAEEAKEMQQSGDSATLNMSAVKDRVDVLLVNNGTVEEFLSKAKEQLNLS